jgi:signal transduction histidine kinase
VLRARRLGGPLAAIAQTDRHPHGAEPGSSTAVSDGFLTCHRHNAELIVAYADDRLRTRLALPDLRDLVGVPLVEVLGSRVSVESRNYLAVAVAAARHMALEVATDGDDLRLVLAPTLFDEVWVGALAPSDRPAVRIEAAVLQPVSPPQTPQSPPAAGESGSPIPLVANILDGVRSLIGIRDTAGRYLLVNSSMAEFYGVPPDAFLGKTPEQLGLPDHVSIDANARSEIEPMIARDIELTDATGHRRRFDISWRHVPSANRRAAYLLEVAMETARVDEQPDPPELREGAERPRPRLASRPADARGPEAEANAPVDAQSRLEEAMRVSNELALEVRQLEAEIREISQRERERIGHDLHDGLGQELTGVSLLLKSLEDAIECDAPQLLARVHSVRSMVEQSIATARSLAQGLSPVHLDRDGLAGALEQLAASSEALYGVPVRFTRQGDGSLPAQLAGAPDLYRIAQEAVRNAARHSGASEIRLKLVIDDDQLTIIVEDDGHGIAPGASANRGMGLKIMRYRASIVGASLEIGTRDGGGTVVRCSLRYEGEGVT